MKIGFCGHRDCFLEEKEIMKLEKIIESIIKSATNIEFYLGGYGSFDNICLSLLKKLKEEYNNFEIIFVTPYLENNYISNRVEMKNYDKTLYPPIENTPKKFAIEKRNFYMVDNANVLICYVEHKFGGAYKMFKRAMNKGVKCYNLA